MAFNIGDSVGDYQVIGILGAGGMGKVYKVRNTISDRVEAMKVLLPDLANEPELGDRFTREIKLLASLNHPNIAALHTALRLENQLLMVMEFVEGRTLEDRLKSGEGRLPPGEAVDAMIQVLAALGYAHERGVVHRDIKPANMMETPEGVVKLMDFGIAKAAADRRLTMTGTTLGSLYYMSPEQVKGSAALDGRSDLYSAGVSFYEMITGTRPFRGDSDYSIMVAHLEQNAKPPIEIDPSLPPDLNEIIMTAIQKEPGNRFQTAQAFRAALESVRPALAAKPAAMRAAAAAPAVGPASRPAPAPMPTVPQQPASTVPAAAWAQQAAPAAQGVPTPPQAAPRSRRGLWMALGGLMVIAMLAAAALQLPRFLGTKASEPQTPAADAQQATPEPAQPGPAETAQPAAESQAPASQPAPRATFEQPVQPPSQTPPAAMTARPARGALANPPAAAGTRRQTPAAPAAAEQQPAAAPVQTAASSAAAPQSPAQPQADPAAMAELRERLRMLSSRANAASRSLKTLEAQQQASGVGLRGDISAAWDSVSGALEEARQAAKDGDAASAKRALDTAERDLDRLDKFLGR